MKRFSVFLLLFAVLFLVASCSPDPEPSVAGYWRSTSGSTISMSSNGAYTFTIPDESPITGTYAVLDDTITYDNNPYPYDTFQFAVTKTTLTQKPTAVPDPATQVYSRL